MTEMILIADSGSTKTDWTLLDRKAGTVVTALKTQGLNPVHQSDAQVADVIHAELLTALDGAAVAAVHFYGAGCSGEPAVRMAQMLTETFPTARVEVQSDLLAAARALCGRAEGVACILGTGANSGLYDGSAIVGNTPALGYILGDEGSGAVLGRLLLNGLYKGTLPPSLRDDFEREMHLSLPYIINKVYREPMANRFLASLSPFVVAHLECEPLREMVVGSFRDFFLRNIRPYGRPDLPVHFVGSVAHHYRALLAEAAGQTGFRLGTVAKSPTPGLIAYHASF